MEEACINHKQYNEAKGQTQESINNVTTEEWKMFINNMEVNAEQEQKEQQEHIQQVTNQNSMLVNMVQEQQKRLRSSFQPVKHSWIR